MQIIFDSEEEKKEMVAAITECESCPSDMGLECSCTESGSNCRVCWKTALEAVEKKEG